MRNSSAIGSENSVCLNCWNRSNEAKVWLPGEIVEIIDLERLILSCSCLFGFEVRERKTFLHNSSPGCIGKRFLFKQPSLSIDPDLFPPKHF
jgi:hypothetical protein